MSAPEQDEDRETVVETVDEEELYGPSEELLENVSAALAEGDIPQVEALIEDLHPADVADLIEHLEPDERKLFVDITRHVIEAETISHLDETVRDEVVEQLGPEAWPKWWASSTPTTRSSCWKIWSRSASRKCWRACPPKSGCCCSRA
jgi:hypothetical protein